MNPVVGLTRGAMKLNTPLVDVSFRATRTVNGWLHLLQAH